MLNLSLAGCGFLGVYHIGVIKAFRELNEPTYLFKISGSSAGALVGACTICECSIEEMLIVVAKVAYEIKSNKFGPFQPGFNINKMMKYSLEKYLIKFINNIFYNEMFMWETFTNRILPADAHKKCSGRLHVSLTSAKNGKNLIVNKFNSKEDLIQVSLFIY